MVTTIKHFRLAQKGDKNTIRASQLKDVIIEVKVDSLEKVIKLRSK